MPTDKRSLIFPVGLLAMPTAGTRTTGVPWINEQERHTSELRLVGYKRAPLPKGPSGMTTALGFANRCPTLPDPGEILQGQGSRGALRLLHQSFAAAAYLAQTSARTFGVDFVEDAPPSGVVCPCGIDGSTREGFSHRIHGQIDDAQVHADHVDRRNGYAFRHVDDAQQIQFPLPSRCEVCA